MGRFFLAAGAIALAAAVAMGAMSQHAAASATHPDAARLLQTAVLYQFVHGLGLVALGLLARTSPSRWLKAAGAFLIAGIVLFCGSLCVLALTGAAIVAFIPIGGTAFIVGWLNLAAYAIFEKA
jgi:uncharacterized membrane protein YgdD (TMEM256/DUF423 family)